MPLLPLVQFDDLLGVDGEALVRIHHHAEEAGVSLEGKKAFIRQIFQLSSGRNLFSSKLGLYKRGSRKKGTSARTQGLFVSMEADDKEALPPPILYNTFRRH